MLSIDELAKRTDVVLTAIALAQTTLRRQIQTNGYGILADH